MKVAFLSESPADEAGIRIITEGLLQKPVEPVALPNSFRVRGWGSVAGVVSAVMRHVHYRTDCSGLVVVIDSNRSPVHQANHDANTAGCRFCTVQLAVEATHLAPVHGKPPFSVALGLAVPAIEGWYLCGVDGRVREASWAAGNPGYTTRTLKESVYGTDRPTLALETTRAEAAAQVLLANLDCLAQRFPGGFGPLAATVRSWRPVAAAD